MFKKIIAFLTLLIICSVSAFSQTCNHTNLSLKYDYKISKKKEKDGDGMITLEIINKSTRRTEQKIVINLENNVTDVFTNCSDTRSYITGYNKNKEISDNDYGDLIVADLNLDGKEDLTIKFQSGGNAGPGYKFFTMRKDGTFKETDYLSVKKGWKIIEQSQSNEYRKNISSTKSNTTGKEKKWNLFRAEFIRALDAKDKKKIISLTSTDFFAGGDNATRIQWLNREVFNTPANYNLFKKYLLNAKDYRATGNSEGDYFFDFVNGNWKFAGVMGD